MSMKALYLLFGLLLLTTIGIAPPAPFLVGGWVQYSNGDPVNDPQVNLTNLNTGKVFTAEISNDCYQILPVNISAGDVVRFNVTDGVTYNITNYTVTEDDLNNSGIFDYALILVSTSPGITDFSQDSLASPVSPDSPVIEVENETGMSGTANSTAPFMIYGWVFYENGSGCIDPVVNITNLNTNKWWLAETLNGSHYYQLVLNTANIRAGDVIRINASKDGAVWSTNHTIVKNDIDNGIIEVNFNEEGVLPDLTVTQVFSPQKWLIANSSNTIIAEIKNDGTAITDEFNVSLTANGALIDVITVTSMATGANKSVSFNWTMQHDGNYTLLVTADSDNKIEESNEINNNFSRTVYVGTPDIVVTEIYYYPLSPVNDSDPVNITAIIENRGSKGAWVNINFYIVEKTPWGDPSYVNVDPFASNPVYIEAHGVNTTSAIWNATCGIYEIKVVADDSSRTTDITVTPSRDFTVVNINPSPSTAIFGDNVTLNITVMNTGIRTGDAEIYVSLDNGGNAELIYSTSRTLEPGIPDYIVFEWDTSSTNLGGDCNISVVVDPYKNTSEINETNNDMTHSIFVNGTDLAVRDVIIPRPDHIEFEDELYKGDIVNVTARIENRGSIDAANFSVGFYDNDTSGNISLINMTNISSLSAGNYLYINATWDLLDASETEHHMQVRIDHCDNPENDLSNNYNETSRYVIAPWILDVSFSSLSVKEGEDITIAAIVTNSGTRDRNASVKFYSDHIYLDDILFKEKTINVAGNSSNTTEVVWNARPLLSGPMSNLTKTRVISVSVDNSNPAPYSINIEPANLTIEGIVVYPDHNVTITVKNNENRTIHPTFWFYDVNHTVCYVVPNKNYYGNVVKGVYSITHPDALSMSIYFSKIDYEASSGNKAPWFNVTDKNENLIYNKIFPSSKTSFEILNFWTKWGVGDTINITHMQIKGPIKSAALLEYRHLSLNANETKNFTVQWNATMGEDHTLWVQLSNKTQHKNISLNIDLAVTDVSANSTTSDGNLENITAAIANLGYGNASEFKVKFFVDDPNILFYTKNVTNLDSNTTITIPANWTADTWNEKEGIATLNHTIWVEIDRCGNSDLNENNNRKSRSIQINPTRDFSVTNISFIQNKENEHLTINTTIKNFGIPGSANVSIHADKDGRSYQINSTYLNNGSDDVIVQWNNASIVGHYTINAIVDPDNRTFEINESNNSMILPVYIEAPDLTIVNLTIDDSNPLEGDMVNITAEIANVGDRPVNASLIIYDSKRVSEEYNKYISPNRYTKKSVNISGNNATAMRLYLWYKMSYGGNLRLYDNKNRLISSLSLDNDTFSGWTEWVVGDSITVELENRGGSADLMISKYDYLTTEDMINSTIQTTNTTNFTVSWNASTAGERNIVAIIYPENSILELNEYNNSKTEFLRVRGADLTVSELQLTVNGSEINGTIANGTIVNINATITNIGVKPTAKDFNVSLVCDDIYGERMEITKKTKQSLYPNNSTNVNATWNATIGDYTITAIADPENRIFETSNSNNTLSKNVVVLGADLSITDTTFRVMPPDGADINNASSPLYDTDTVVINATIKNRGLVRADAFSAYIFYEYEYLGNEYRNSSWIGDKNDKWINKGYDGAECICIHITNLFNINDRLIVYDGTGTEIARPDRSCWIPVMGDTATIKYSNVHGLGFTADYYAGNITKFENITLIPAGSINISMRQPVGTGNHPARVFADPENIVPGDPDDNNYADSTLHVLPSRDFFPEIYLTHNGSVIGVNNTVLDGNTVTVDVGIRMGINESDPYHEYREGIVDVDIIDEHDWIDIPSPRNELTPYGYAYVISYPGADAIRLHFSELDVSPRDVVEIRDENGTLLCTISSYTPISPWVSGDEIYVYRVRKPVAYGDYRYIACSIDKYQYRIINRTTVEIAANGTAHTSARFSPGAGDHIIHVITDPDDKIGELNESNNEVNKTMYVEPCRDPAVVNIAFSPEMPDPGDAVIVTANVTNYGNITSTFTIDLYAAKYEYRPYESLHPYDKSKPMYDVFEKDITTYPEANWTGVHFTRISTIDGLSKVDMHVYDRDGEISENYYGFEGRDVWAWIKGDVLKLDTKQVCNLHGCIWGFSIDTVAHTVTLNQTTVTLEPGETASVTGILPNVRIGNRSITYTITAVVDQDNTVFETNELNNVVSRELVANCPDLMVDFSPPDKAVIRNIGTGVAKDVEVRMWHDVNYTRYKEKYHRTEQRYMRFPPDEEKPYENPDAVRVHFEKLTFDEGEFRVKNGTEIIHTLPPGNYPDTWVEVEGKVSRIYCNYTDVKIDRYEYAYDLPVGDVLAGDIKKKEIPWTEYEEPYNLTIDADPGNDVIESNEDNNNKTIRMGADLTLKRHTIPDYLQVDKPLNFIVRIENKGTMSIPAFNVTLYVKPDNGTMIPVENHTIEKLGAKDDCHVKFEWKPPTDGKYRFIIRVDPEDRIVELDEDNNELILYDILVFKRLGYGGSYLKTYAKDEANGGFIFKMGDRDGKGDPDQWYQGNFQNGNTYKTKWNISLPADANIKIARLYLYWGFTKGYTQPTEFNLKFNDYSPTQSPGYPDYSDYPIEEGIEKRNNYASGVYCYDVKDYITGSDEATVTIRNLHGASYTCIAGMSIVIIYESDSGVLTKYWINEGADLLAARGGGTFFSSLSPDECTTKVFFDGGVDFDGLSNATLITVVPWGNYGNELVDKETYTGTKWAGKKRNGLYFNSKELKDGAWICDYSWDSVGIDERDVEEHLVKRDNVAEMQDRGDGMMISANAFLVLRYPPDLAVTDIDAPVSAVIGNKYVINTTINNEGRSNATDFNVSFYSNNVRVERHPISRLDSGDNITLQFNWKPMYMGKIYQLKVVADVVSGPDWVELDEDNNEMTKNVPIVEGGFGNESGPVGEGGAGAGGSGDGEGVSLFDMITGILMKGSILKDGGGGGGGGLGEFSLLEWIMKGIVLTICSILVYFGYSMEKRRHNNR